MTPRSYLYVPGDRPRLLAKASERGADALILDLEDGVAASAKEEARRAVAEWLAAHPGAGPELWVRINAVADLAAADVAAVADREALTGLVVPKAEDPGHLRELDRLLPAGVRIQPLVESARGVLAAAELAAAPRVGRLQLGEADLTADLGMDPAAADEALGPIRLRMVTVSAATRIDPPVAPVSTDFRDLEAFEASTRRLVRMGFGARSAIHPAQVEVINRVLSPNDEEVERARALLAAAEAAEGGVFVDDDGRMVDEAVLRSARRVLARARREAP